MKEGKEIRVSLGTVVSIVIILILLVLGGIMFYMYNTKIVDLEKIITEQKANNKEEEISKNSIQSGLIQNTTINNNSINNNSVNNNSVNNNAVNNTSIQTGGEVNNENNETDEFVVPSLFTSNAKKTSNETDNYSLRIFCADNSFTIKVVDAVPTIWTNLDKTVLSDYGIDVSKMKLSNTEQKISGFTKKVVDVLTINDEHQFASTCFLFLMEDGTVEYSDLQNMVDNVSSQGKIEGLNNIIRLQKVELTNPGYDDTSAIAIDKQNNYYDISKYIN